MSKLEKIKLFFKKLQIKNKIKEIKNQNEIDEIIKNFFYFNLKKIKLEFKKKNFSIFLKPFEWKELFQKKN